MQRQIDDYRIEFQNQGEISRAKEYEQVYVTIITLLDRIVELMGDEVLTIKEYKQILQAGFESVKVGIIPPGLDTVMVGDIERTRLKDTKRIIFLWELMTELFQKQVRQGGIITDTDREFLEKNNYILAPTATDNVFKQKFYCTQYLPSLRRRCALLSVSRVQTGNKKKVLYNKYFNESF